MPLLLEELKDILVYLEVKPARQYTAAAGAYYGQVTSWELGDFGYLIWHRGVGGEGCGVYANDDDLAAYLEPSLPLSPLDRILRTANVRGVDEVPDADPTARYFAAYVLVTKYFEGVTAGSLTGFVLTSLAFFQPRPFRWVSQAQEWIDEEKGKFYGLSEGEICAPTYKIVTQ